MKNHCGWQLDIHWFLPLIMAIAALILLVFTLDNREHEARINQSLERSDELSRLHVRLNTNILKSRLFYLDHFDGIALGQQQLQTTSRQLLEGVDRPRLLAAEKLHELFRQKDEEVEAFKTSISVYKNSEQYIGVIIGELMQILSPSQTQAPSPYSSFLLTFNRFHNQLRSFLSRPNSEKRPQLESLLAELATKAEGLPNPARSILDQILAHAMLLIQQAERIDKQVVQVIDPEQDRQLAALQRDLLADQQQLSLTLKRYEQTLYGIIVALTLYTFFILVKLKLANDLLELRVKERTRDLGQATQKALDADAAKSAFLAHMSHEIRTPLNGVIGITASLLKKDMDPLAKDMVQNVSHCGKSLLSLINDILDFSKIEANELKLDRGPVNLRAVISEALAIVGENARQQNVKLEQDIDPKTPALVEGDRGRMGQILLNLLSNAIKFSPGGRVIIQLNSRILSSGLHQMTLHVIDNGIGITADQLKDLFQDYAQAHPGIAHSFGGTGLGLVISKKLAELMGGRIEVKSQYGAGSTFTLVLTLPELAPPAEPSTDPTPRPLLSELHPQRILVVDDNFINRKVASDLLRDLGYEPHLAKDAPEALELIKNNAYDIVFTDLRMPIMDGYELVEKVQGLGRTSLRFVAMTASATPLEKEKCWSRGIRVFICKPIKEQDLVEVLQGPSLTEGQGLA